MGFSAALARQKLRDAAKVRQQDAAAEKEMMRPAVAHTSRAPAFLREALRRDRDALSPALRRRLTAGPTSNATRRVVGQWGGAGGAVCEDHLAFCGELLVFAAA